MKPEKQRIAIAEECGWTEISERCKWGLPPGAFDCGTEDCLENIPHYVNDLNAMHEAEKTLDLWARRKFRNMLSRHTIPKSAAIHATAPQRAEAFLRTVGRWEE